MSDDRVPGSSMTSETVGRKASERQRRNQGFTDALEGRERRVVGDSVYGEGFRRGKERRERQVAT